MALKFLGRSVGWVVVTLLLVVNLMAGARLYSQEAPVDDRESAYEKMALFTKVLEQVRENYVDEDKTAYEDLIYEALKGMLQGLDHHSQFMEPDLYSDMKDDTAGRFGGLGIVISLKGGILTVIAPMEDTPGYRVGLMAGDKIIEIDGESTEGVELHDAVKKLRGEPGSSVTLRLLRPRTQEIKEVDIVREIIKVPSVKDAKILENDIGYVRITQFNAPTGRALQKALNALRDQHMKALVLDLRNNPGGLLTAAVEVSQMFLKRGDLIVFTQGRDEKQRQMFRARGRIHYTDFPVAILVNQGSASASEIVAGALQDQQRAILIGEKTFGKGSVQSVLPMEDGSAIRITTAKYYTPSEKVIHERGIEPDIVVPISPVEMRTLALLRSRPDGAEITEEEAALDDVGDAQLERAVDVLKGIMIFEARAADDIRYVRKQ